MSNLASLVVAIISIMLSTPDDALFVTRHTENGDAYDDDSPNRNQAESPNTPSAANEEKTNSRGDDKGEPHQEGPKITDWLIGWSTIATGAFTLALAVFTYRLWTSGEKHSERQLRAYVLVEKGGVGNFIAGEVPYAKVRFRNSGQTPASQISVMITMDLCKFPRPNFEPFSGDDSRRSRGPIGPETKFTIPVALKRTIDLEERAKVVCGDKAIYVFGRVDYMDVFERKQWTTFRFIVRGRGEDFGDNPDLTVASEGNDAT